MPSAAHIGLAKSAAKKGLSLENFDRYVYGGLANMKKEKEAKKRLNNQTAKP